MHGSDPTAEITLPEAYRLLVAQAEDRIARRLRALPPDQSISCRAGCAACCRQLVVVSPMEAFALAAWTDERPELAAAVDARLAALEAAVAVRPALAAALAQLERQGGYPGPAAGGALELAWFAAGIPCVFLDKERCQVYSVRPFGCREHFALSPPELCAVDLDQVVTPETRLEFKMVATQAGAAAFGLEDRLLPLPGALAYARARPVEAARRAPAARFLAQAALAERRVGGALAALLRRAQE